MALALPVGPKAGCHGFQAFQSSKDDCVNHACSEGWFVYTEEELRRVNLGENGFRLMRSSLRNYSALRPWTADLRLYTHSRCFRPAAINLRSDSRTPRLQSPNPWAAGLRKV